MNPANARRTAQLMKESVDVFKQEFQKGSVPSATAAQTTQTAAQQQQVPPATAATPVDQQQQQTTETPVKKE